MVKIISKTLITKIILIMVFFLVMFNCSKKNPVNPIVPITIESGNITIRLVDTVVDIDLVDFLVSYEEFQLAVVTYLHPPSNTIIFSFNKLLIDEYRFLEMIREDERVIRAELEPFDVYIPIEITVRLKSYIVDEIFDDFLISYSEY